MDRLFRDLDAPRPLPAGLRASLQRALVEGEGELRVLRRLDAPRALPPGLRARLEATLAHRPPRAAQGPRIPGLPPRAAQERRIPGLPPRAAGDRRVIHRFLRAVPRAAAQPRLPSAFPEAAPQPRLPSPFPGAAREPRIPSPFPGAGREPRIPSPLPGAAREPQLLRPLPRSLRPALAAATAVAVAASVLVVLRGEGSSSPVPARIRALQPSPKPPGPGATPSPAAASESPHPAPAARGGVAPPPPAASLPEAPPPPFAFRGPAPRGAAIAGGGPLRVAVVRGDPAQEAGFRAYVDLLNAGGGIGGRRVEVLEASATSPAGAALLTVNLSGSAVAGPDAPPRWAPGPVVETLAATEDVLSGRVFGLAGPPERQAHLLADAVYPQPAPAAVAVIYRGPGGIFAGAIPQALRRVLEARQVKVIEVDYRPGAAVTLPAADAVFLSLDRDDTLSFLTYARTAGYRPRVTACIFPMLDTGIVGRLGNGYLVMAPYSLGSADEAAALQRASGRPLATGSIHGWVVAKSVAVALWRSGADTPEEATRALSGLAGYDPGFAPPFAFRPQTNARTPEGILYEVRDGAFVPLGGFRTDPF